MFNHEPDDSHLSLVQHKPWTHWTNQQLPRWFRDQLLKPPPALPPPDLTHPLFQPSQDLRSEIAPYWILTSSCNVFGLFCQYKSRQLSVLHDPEEHVSLTVMSLHSIQHPFTPFYNTPYIYALWVYDAIQPSLQIRSTLTLSNGLPLLSLLSRYCQWLTHDRVWVSPIATPMDKPQNDGHPLWLLSLSLPNTMCKHCNKFVRPFTLFSNKLYLVQSWSS